MCIRDRYCGTPLKYSIGEANTTKSVTIIDMKEKGNTTVYTVDLKPLHDVVVMKDTFANILQRKNVKNDDYVYFQLQDERMVFDAMNTPVSYTHLDVYKRQMLYRLSHHGDS